MIRCKICKKTVGLTEVKELSVLCSDCEQLQSNARKHLHLTFADLEANQKFQFVNSVMGGATPKGWWFVKVNANQCKRDEEIFNVTSNMKVEL